MKNIPMIHTILNQTIMQKKKRNQKDSLGSMVSVFFLVLLVSLLVFPQYSNAGGVNSNTITPGSTSTGVIGNPTSETVTNDDGSQTTTTTTPVTTTTTTTTVTQTEVPNIVKNPTFTNHLGGGSFANWSITSCPGGCAASPSVGFMAGNGGTIKQTFTSTDMFGTEIDATEQGQGLTFTFGAEVDNDQAGNNLGDAWSIKLEMFNSSNQSLGSSLIGDSLIFPPTVKTGTLEIDSGIIPNSGVITLFGDSALNGGTCCAAFFNDILTTFVYNSIESQITTSTTYTELITTVSCETLNSCAPTVDDTIELVTSVIDTAPTQEVVIATPITISPIIEMPSPEMNEPTLETKIEPIQELEVNTIETELDNGTETNTQESGTDTQSNDIETADGSASGEVRAEADNEGEGEEKKTSKSVGVKKREAKQKVATKIVKKMGDKGRYNNTNQIKTLVVMQVLGNTREFFSTQVQLQDTPNFFTDIKLPDKNISDNNFASYFLFGGSDSDHNELVNSQYRR